MLTPGVTPIRRVHLTELRVALDEAYAAAGRPAPDYTDPMVTAGETVIKASHVMELRAAVAALESWSNDGWPATRASSSTLRQPTPPGSTSSSLLCLLMLLRMPYTRIVYATS